VACCKQSVVDLHQLQSLFSLHDARLFCRRQRAGQLLASGRQTKHPSIFFKIVSILINFCFHEGFGVIK
jgi:hypothetical protein